MPTDQKKATEKRTTCDIIHGSKERERDLQLRRFMLAAIREIERKWGLRKS